MNTPTLETARLILRRFTEKDLDALFLILKDESANQFLPWFPPKSLDEAKDFFEKRYASKYRLPQGYDYAICLRENNFPIGYIHVGIEESHDLGYGLRREFWHRGIATEAAKAVIEQVKKDGLPYITATHDRDNPRSGSVMQKVGMTYRYSYEEQWRPKNFPVIFRMYQLNFAGSEDFVYQKYWNISRNHFIEKL
ncbi:MAG: GNAT family N-acetyltransferase [Oscillospiraceae bacterium]|nr:GNAT family N-acetyltransferase [Oscillospiraceae bacterium]